MKFIMPTSVFLVLLVFSTSLFAQTDLRENAWRELESLRDKIKQQEKILLSVPEGDIEKYKNFLSQENTGIIRLLPREKYDYKITINGGGAYYSFDRKSHEYGFGSDISLEQKNFSVGFAGRDYGFFKNLGDVEIENITLESDSVKQLAQYESPLNPNANQKTIIYPTANQSRTPAEAGKTYALRSINVGRSDILVAFRVLREDFDGSVVILWKILKTFSFSHEIKDKVIAELNKRNFTDVRVEYQENVVVLRGTAPKGKLAEVVRTAQEASGKAIRIELTEQ